MSKNSRRIDLAEAEQLVNSILFWAAQSGCNMKHLEVAGSYRRGCDSVGDIDLVIDSRSLGPFIAGVIPGMAIPGQDLVIRKRDGMITGFYFNGTRIEFYVADEPTEFGAKLLFASGSADFNIRQRRIAISRGMKLNDKGVFIPTVKSGIVVLEQKTCSFDGSSYPNLGLYPEGKNPNAWVKIAGRTEIECFKALAMEYVSPEHRE